MAQMLLFGAVSTATINERPISLFAAGEGHHGAMNALGTLYLQGRTVARVHRRRKVVQEGRRRLST